jgi:hypothetical protein
MELCDREVSLEARGTERTASMLTLVLAWRSRLSQAFPPETQFAGRSEAQAHCLALEGSPLDRSHTLIIRARPRDLE